MVEAPGQLELPGIDVPPKLVFIADDKPIEGLCFDEDALVCAAEQMSLEHLDPDYGWGLTLSGTVVENAAFKGVE